jgi:hypothetical protein
MASPNAERQIDPQVLHNRHASLIEAGQAGRGGISMQARASVAAAIAATVLLSAALAQCSREPGFESELRPYTPLQIPTARAQSDAPHPDERTAFESR